MAFNEITIIYLKENMNRINFGGMTKDKTIIVRKQYSSKL